MTALNSPAPSTTGDPVGLHRVLEPSGVLFFGSAPGLDKALINQLAVHPEAKHLVIDLKRLGRVDYTGALALKAVFEEARSANLTFQIVGIPAHAERVVERVLQSRGPLPPD